MICTQFDWALSEAFVPYAPTNAQLCQMIAALQPQSVRETIPPSDAPENRAAEQLPDAPETEVQDA